MRATFTIVLAAALLAGCATQHQPLAGACALVAELYERQDRDDSPFFQTDSREKVDAFFEPVLADFIWREAVDANGEIGALDFVPMWNAQDFDVTDFVIHPPVRDGSGARVDVTFTNSGKPERITYRLVRVRGEWRIANIEYLDGTNLRAILAAVY
jgi:hypothetical protein